MTLSKKLISLQQSTGHFALNGKETIKHTHCRLLQKADGYNYGWSPAEISSTTQAIGVSDKI